MLLLCNTESDEGHKTKILNIVMYATANKLIKREEKNYFLKSGHRSYSQVSKELYSENISFYNFTFY